MDYPKRKSARLPNFNYSEAGAYFITLCTNEKRCIFGRVLDASTEADLPHMQLSETGSLVLDQIRAMSEFYPHISVDHFVVMPNHIHLLLSVCQQRSETTPANAAIPSFLSTLKRFSNKQACKNLWQRSYHDHIIRNEQDYLRIWQYIDSNAAKWQQDCYYQD